MRYLLLVLRLVPVVLSLWWADVRDPGSATRIVRAAAASDPDRLPLVRRGVLAGAVTAWTVALVALFWGDYSLLGAVLCALAGTYSAISLLVLDRLEAL